MSTEFDPTAPFAPDYSDAELSADAQFDAMDAPDAALAIADEAPAQIALGAYTAQQPEFDTSDILMPRLALLQGLSKAVAEGRAQPGKWFIDGMDKALDTVHIVPLQFAHRQEYRPSRENFANLVCWANAARKVDLVGLGEFAGRKCEDCPFYQWTGEGDNRKPPACTGILSYLVYVKEYEGVALLDFRGVQYTAGKQLNSLVLVRRLARFVAALGVTRKQTKQGSVFVPTVSLKPQDKDTLTQAQAFIANA